MSDILYESAVFYKNQLMNRKFTFNLQKKAGRDKLQLDVIFSADNYKHLFGLHKLDDKPYIKTRASSTIFKSILDKEITYEMIKDSPNLHYLNNRLDKYADVRNVINSKSLFLKSLSEFIKSSYGTNVDEENYLITEQIKNNDINQEVPYLFLVKQKAENVAHPKSFFVDKAGKYRNNAVIWTITSIQEKFKDGTVVLHNLPDDDLLAGVDTNNQTATD